MPNFSPMPLVFNANSGECPLEPGQNVERRVLPEETMESLRIGGFEMRGTARTYSKPRTDTDPLLP
jgi:hypothetical protein